MDINIYGGNNMIAPNATSIVQNFNIKIELQCNSLIFIANLAYNLLN